jgi:hypothetical protein
VIWARVVLVLFVVVLVAGCATGATPPPPRGSQPSRVRCLSDPHETGMRPLFFFFCVESP